MVKRIVAFPCGSLSGFFLIATLLAILTIAVRAVVGGIDDASGLTIGTWVLIASWLTLSLYVGISVIHAMSPEIQGIMDDIKSVWRRLD